MSDFNKVSIIGLGLIGGSLGLAIKKYTNIPEVWGIARRDETVKEATQNKIVDRATTSMEEGLDNTDLVFICTPVKTIVEFIRKIAPIIKKEAIVTDVGSSKQTIVREGEKYLQPKAHFIGGHPMTGSEKSGLSAARASLFNKTQYILTPTDNTNLQAYRKLHSIISNIGASIIAINPQKHDLFVANISHLPHLVSASLVNLVNYQADEKENLLMLAAGGFRDVTRIAAGDPSMWLDICLDNKEAIVEAIDSLGQELAKFKSSIQTLNQKSLFELLKEAQQTRLALPAQLYEDRSNLRELLIPVIDRPGIISEITVTLGNLGINIHDIELLHSSPTSALLKLIISGKENSEKAKTALEEKGYEVTIETIPE